MPVKETSPEGSSSKRRRTSPEMSKEANTKIDEDDFYRRSNEFRLWLKEERGKYFDKLDTEDAKKYFAKFIREWNKGRLPQYIYTAGAPRAISSHKWKFKAPTASEARMLREVKEENGESQAAKEEKEGSGWKPAVERLQEKREQEEDEREYQRKKQKYDKAKRKHEEREEERDNRAVGRERMLEKKKERRQANAEYASVKDEDAGLDMDERTLMGGGDSFADAIRRRDAARARADKRRMGGREERDAEKQDRLRAYRDKEDATMAMFREMAKERFG